MYSILRSFHSSSRLLALRDHRLFPKVNWERIEAGNYAVVDPVNPGVILYLSEQDYIMMVRVAITSNRTLKVLATPIDTPVAPTSSDPDKPSQNSPSPLNVHNENVPFAGKLSGTARRRLQTLFSSPLAKFLFKEKQRIQGKTKLVKTSMIRLSDRNIRGWFHTWHDLVHWWTRGKQLSTVAMTERTSFGLKISSILRHNGATHLISRFKVSLFVLNSFLSGRKLTTTQELGLRIRLQNGLPAILPRKVRAGIRNANMHFVHIWTSVLFSYKGLLGSWVEPDLQKSSISQPHPSFKGNPDFENFQQLFANYFWYNIIVPLGIRDPVLKVKNAFFTTHAGPNSPISILGAGLDAFLWFCSDAETLKTQVSELNALVPWTMSLTHVEQLLPHIREHIGVPYNVIREWFKTTAQDDLLKQFRLTAKMFKMSYLMAFSVLPHYEANSRKSKNNSVPIMMTNVGSAVLGLNLGMLKTNHLVLQRLHNLYEAAGKVRTIAIVDYWTNLALKPLHDWMFEILRKLPQDATFDQEGKVRDFASRGYKDIYSLDLKSATDLIPLSLYRALFSWILPMKIVDLWLDLLVNRNFKVPKETLKSYPDHPRTVRYTTGQPMGALTSWAAMAMVHHALVLFAASNAGEIRQSGLLGFKDYLILGDDVVIANPKVAQEYIRLCASLSIPIGLAKSFVSANGMFNFANQSFVSSVNVSPLSMKEEAQISSLPARTELFLRAVRRGWRTVTSQRWLASSLKLFIPEKAFERIIKPTLLKRGMSPAIAWVLGSLLSPGTTKFSFTGVGMIPLESFYAAISQAGSKLLWSTRIEKLSTLVRAPMQNAIIAVLAQIVNTVYSDFLRNRKRLEVFDEWVSTIVSPDIEWLLMRVFKEARGEAFQRWQTEFRMPMKEIQVATRIPSFNVFDVEAGTGRNWNELIEFISNAEKALPQVPDFTQHTIEVLTALAGGADLSKAEQTRALNAFMRLTNIIGMVDHLGSFVTPGIVLPETEVSPISKETEEEHSSPLANNQAGGASVA